MCVSCFNYIIFAKFGLALKSNPKFVFYSWKCFVFWAWFFFKEMKMKKKIVCSLNIGKVLCKIQPCRSRKYSKDTAVWTDLWNEKEGRRRRLSCCLIVFVTQHARKSSTHRCRWPTQMQIFMWFDEKHTQPSKNAKIVQILVFSEKSLHQKWSNCRWAYVRHSLANTL